MIALTLCSTVYLQACPNLQEAWISFAIGVTYICIYTIIIVLYSSNAIYVHRFPSLVDSYAVT